MRLIATLELPRKCDHPHKTQFSVRALNIRELAKALAIHTVKIYPLASLSATADCKLCEYDKIAAQEIAQECPQPTPSQNAPKSPEVAPQAAQEAKSGWWPFKLVTAMLLALCLVI